LRRYTGHTANVISLAVAPDGRRFFTGAQDDTVRVWDIEQSEPVATIPALAEGGTTTVALSHDGRTLAIGDYEDLKGPRVRLLEAHSLVEVARLGDQKRGDFTPVAFTTDDASLWTVMQSTQLSTVPSEWIRWDLARRAVGDRIVKPEPGLAGTAQPSPDGRHVLTAGADGLSVWELTTLRRVRHVRTASYSVLYAPDGRTFATTGFMNTVSLWDAATFEKGQTVGMGLNPAPGAIATSLAFSPSGRSLAAGGYDSTIRVWRVESDAAKAPPAEGK
jgi:WD40 repeat protein